MSTEWRDLLMLNYEIDPALLQPLVPRDMEVDSFKGTTYVSLVGLRFARTKLFGFISVPFHSNFDEVNLRIYVRRREGNEIRRGVMFIREIVSLPAVTFLARIAYAENYRTLPLRHSIDLNDSGGSIEYSWELKRQRFRLHGQTEGSPSLAADGSLEQFISEHYWGCSRRRDGGSLEYHVAHKPWRIWRASNAAFEGEGAALYGSDFGSVLSRPPRSAFIADGSAVSVFTGVCIA
ncbi:MAG: DUF2071 domain-containing protein [Candidatus Acidiferrales bacterium]